MKVFRRFRAAPRKTVVPAFDRPAYADRHRGETALVLGNGPSLALHAEPIRALAERTGAVVLGANHVTPLSVPDYHAFTNRKRFVDYAHTIDPRSKVLLSPYFPDELVRSHFDGAFESIMYVDDNDARFEVLDGVIQSGCRTVSVLLIGVAAVMGAERILVAGLDGYATEADPSNHHHAPTRVMLHGADEYARVDAYTRRFLSEIQEYLRRNGRQPFTIVTPTNYDEHYRAGVLSPEAEQ